MEALKEVVQTEAELIHQVVQDLEDAGIPVPIVSSGSTQSFMLCENLQGLTEVRAGNYIFNDVSIMQMGLVEGNHCALRVIATVSSTPFPGRATIDAGSKTLTSDKAPHAAGYGHIVGHPLS